MCLPLLNSVQKLSSHFVSCICLFLYGFFLFQYRVLAVFFRAKYVRTFPATEQLLARPEVQGHVRIPHHEGTHFAVHSSEGS